MTTLSKNCTQNIGQHLDQAQQGLYQTAVQWLETQRLKMAVKRERQQLLSLSDDTLRDMGITHAEAYIEASRVDLPLGRLAKC